MSQKTIVIIGGAHGGPTAAARARQFNEDARIILVEKAPHVTWVQADLRHRLLGDLSRLEASLKERNRNFCERYQIEEMTSTEAVAIDMDARAVVVRKGNQESRIGFDSVVYAGGAVSQALNIKELDGPFVSNFRNLEDLRKIKGALKKGAKKAVILGGGPYGLEAAGALREAGCEVVIIEKAPRILSKFSLPAAHAVAAELKEQGVRLLVSEQVIEAQKQSKGFTLSLAGGGTLEADLVVVTIGSMPRTELLTRAGAALQSDGSLRVDANMLTTLPHVYACGSAVSVPEIITRERMWLPQPSIIERTAQVAGQNAAIVPQALKDQFEPSTGTFMIEVGKRWFARTGLTKAEAWKAYSGDDLFTTTIHSRSAEVWHAGEDLTVCLMVNRKENRIIGGEVWGQSGVERRIDILSLAISEGLSPAKLVDLDMAYAASLGPAFDPLKAAGQYAKLTIMEKSKVISGESLALWMTQDKPFSLIDVSRLDDSENPSRFPSRVFHMPLENLRDRLENIDKSYPVVVSSRSGRRSFIAQRVLEQRGFEDVYHLDGGSLTWALMMN